MALPKTTKLNGGDVDVERDLSWGDELVLVMRVKVDSVATKSGAGGAEVARTLKPLVSYELEGDLGPRTINALVERARLARQAGANQALEGLGDTWDDVVEETPDLVGGPATGNTAVTAEEAAHAVDDDAGWMEPKPELDDAATPLVVDDIASTPPFDGYDTATIPVVDDWITAAGEDGTEPVVEAERARWVLAYEAAHKARKRLLDKCYGYVTTLPDGPAPEPSGDGDAPDEADLELDDDEPDLGDETTLDGPEPDVEVDDDFDLED